MTAEEFNSGWFVELDDRVVAILTEPQFFDMFWVSLRLQPISDDPIERLRIATDRRFWLESKLTLRNRVTELATEKTFVAGDVFTDTGRVIWRESNLP